MAYSAQTDLENRENRRDLGAGTMPRKRQSLTAAGVATYNTGDAGSDTDLTTLRTRVGEIEQALKDLGILT